MISHCYCSTIALISHLRHIKPKAFKKLRINEERPCPVELVTGKKIRYTSLRFPAEIRWESFSCFVCKHQKARPCVCFLTIDCWRSSPQVTIRSFWIIKEICVAFEATERGSFVRHLWPGLALRRRLSLKLPLLWRGFCFMIEIEPIYLETRKACCCPLQNIRIWIIGLSFDGFLQLASSLLCLTVWWCYPACSLKWLWSC